MAHLQEKISINGHIEERRSVWHIALRWKDAYGNEGRKSFSTKLPVRGNKRKAEEMLAAAKRELKEKLQNAPEIRSISFAHALKVWLESKRNNVKMTTFGTYQTNIMNIIIPHFEKKKILLEDLTGKHINDFYEQRLEKVSARTIHRYHSNIMSTLKYAKKKKWIKDWRSIADDIELPTVQKFSGKFLKKNEVIELFDAATGHKLELAIILGAYYGLRRSEIVGLRWESIDFDNNTITIEHTVTCARVDNKLQIFENDSTKSTTSYRSLPLVSIFRSKLLSIRREQEEYARICGKSYNKHEGKYIYTDPLGNRIKPDYITDMFPKFLDKHGFRKIRFHDLRHSSASLLIAAGVPLKNVQEWLGHGSIVITADTYGHLEFESKKITAKAMTWLEDTEMGRGSNDDN